MVAKFRAEMTSPARINIRSKTALQEQKSKYPNVEIFTDTSGRISENLHLDWSRIYSIFDNDNFLAILHDQLAYIKIQSSQLHLIASRPLFMPYIDPVKWALDHVNPKDCVFHDHIGTFVASFHPNIFPRLMHLDLLNNSSTPNF